MDNEMERENMVCVQRDARQGADKAVPPRPQVVHDGLMESRNREQRTSNEGGGNAGPGAASIFSCYLKLPKITCGYLNLIFSGQWVTNWHNG